MSVEPIRRRLEPLPNRSIYPLHRSSQLETCALYWIPVERMPPSWRERQWLMAFFDQLHELMVKKELRQESFLQMKLAAPLGEVKDTLHRHQMKLIPIMGLSRRPGAPMPPIPTEADLEPIIEGKKKFLFDEHVPDYSLWFLTRDERWRRDLFLGYGGYTMIYLKVDPTSAPPKFPDYPGLRSMDVFKAFDVDAIIETTVLLEDQLGPKSRAVFGKGLEEDPGFESVSFVMPLMRARDFLGAKPEEIEEWFTVFDIYIHESPEDGGILIGSKESLDETIMEALDQVRQLRIFHPLYPDEKPANQGAEEA